MAAAVASCCQGKAAAIPTGGILDVIKGLKTKGINLITILNYLPVIVAAIQTLGPKVQEIIEIVSNLIDQFKPAPTPPVVNPLG